MNLHFILQPALSEESNGKAALEQNKVKAVVKKECSQNYICFHMRSTCYNEKEIKFNPLQKQTIIFLNVSFN